MDSRLRGNDGFHFSSLLAKSFPNFSKINPGHFIKINSAFTLKSYTVLGLIIGGTSILVLYTYTLILMGDLIPAYRRDDLSKF
jgi:hypothetical protein